MNNLKYTLNIPMNVLVVFFNVIGRSTYKLKCLRRNWFVIEIARLAEASSPVGFLARVSSVSR